MASLERSTPDPTSPDIDGLLSALRDDLHADATVFVQFGSHDADIVVTNVRVDGDATRWAWMCDGTGPRGFDHDASDEPLSMREGQWCLQAPAKRHFNRFCWFDDDVAQRAPWKRTDAYQSLYEPYEFEEQYRAVLVDHGEVTGWVAALWQQPPRHRELLESKAAKHLGALRGCAGGLHHQPRAPHRLLLDDRGEVLAANPELHEAFDESTQRLLRRRCRPTHDSVEFVRYLNGYVLRTVPMTGEDGVRATLVLVEPLAPVTIDMRKALTVLQRRVAELVAEGHSNGQTAEILDISVNTVKYHLKNIYPIVGVTNRVELASFLSESH